MLRCLYLKQLHDFQFFNFSILMSQIWVIFGNIRVFSFTKIYCSVYGLLVIYFYNLEFILFSNGWNDDNSFWAILPLR